MGKIELSQKTKGGQGDAVKSLRRREKEAVKGPAASQTKTRGKRMPFGGTIGERKRQGRKEGQRLRYSQQGEARTNVSPIRQKWFVRGERKRRQHQNRHRGTF